MPSQGEVDPALTEDNNNINATKSTSKDEQPKGTETIRDILKQFINLKLKDNISKIETELRDFYSRQMGLRDRAKRQLINIQQAKDWLGLVPAGMQIKVKLEVLGNEDVNL